MVSSSLKEWFQCIVSPSPSRPTHPTDGEYPNNIESPMIMIPPPHDQQQQQDDDNDWYERIRSGTAPNDTTQNLSKSEVSQIQTMTSNHMAHINAHLPPESETNVVTHMKQVQLIAFGGGEETSQQQQQQRQQLNPKQRNRIYETVDQGIEEEYKAGTITTNKRDTLKELYRHEQALVTLLTCAIPPPLTPNEKRSKKEALDACSILLQRPLSDRELYQAHLAGKQQFLSHIKIYQEQQQEQHNKNNQ